MPVATIPAFFVGQYVLANIVDIDSDGVTPDTVEALTAPTVNFPSIVSAIVNPGNPRQVRITGLATGNAAVTVGAPGVPSNANLIISVSVSPAPNLSRVEMNGFEGPFAV